MGEGEGSGAGDVGPGSPRARVGLVLAPVAFLALWIAPLPLDTGAHRLLAIFVAVIVLWVTEVLPIAATALLIAPAMILAGVCDAKTAFAPYADPLLFLFVGGFMIARSMTRHGLDRRLALGLVTAPIIRGLPARVRAAFMFAGVVLSMWISNTATTAILLPILIGLMGKQEEEGQKGALTGSLLAVAYACSIGGLGTPVGSPPNLIAMGFLRDAGFELTFFDWVKVGLPAALVMVLVTFLYFQRRFPPVPLLGQEAAQRPRGPLGVGETVTALSFGVAVVGWMTPGLLAAVASTFDFWIFHPMAAWAGEVAPVVKAALPGGAVAIVAASLLFLFREPGGKRVLPWHDAARIDWGIIMLFGGGISLGRQMFDTGLAEALSRGFVELTGVQDVWTLTALVTVFTIFFTETCSNTATSNMLSPLVIAVCAELGVSPMPPVLAVGLAASCAFMLPIATGPNAIVYGTGHVPQTTMMRAGFWLNITCAALIFALLRILCPIYGWG